MLGAQLGSSPFSTIKQGRFSEICTGDEPKKQTISNKAGGDQIDT